MRIRSIVDDCCKGMTASQRERITCRLIVAVRDAMRSQSYQSGPYHVSALAVQNVMRELEG